MTMTLIGFDQVEFVFVAHIHETFLGVLQAMYAYMKAAYLSMMSTEERQPFEANDVALFR